MRSRVLVWATAAIVAIVLVVIVARGGALALLIGLPLLVGLAFRMAGYTDPPGKERYWDRTHDVQERLASDSDNATLSDLDRYR